VLLFEGGPEILPTFGDRLARKAIHELNRIGVEIHLNSIVTAMDRDGVDVKGPDGSVQRVAVSERSPWRPTNCSLAMGDMLLGGKETMPPFDEAIWLASPPHIHSSKAGDTHDLHWRAGIPSVPR